MKIDIEGNLIDTQQNVPSICLWYPRNKENVNEIEVGLIDVRAADSIHISYDFDRDGYSIKQASIFEWGPDDLDCDGDWQEVSFIPAWGREEKKDAETKKNSSN